MSLEELDQLLNESSKPEETAPSGGMGELNSLLSKHDEDQGYAAMESAHAPVVSAPSVQQVVGAQFPEKPETPPPGPAKITAQETPDLYSRMFNESFSSIVKQARPKQAAVEDSTAALNEIRRNLRSGAGAPGAGAQASKETITPATVNVSFDRSTDSIIKTHAERLGLNFSDLKHGLERYASYVAMIESNGDPKAKNPSSSASGLYQFLSDSTATAASRVGRLVKDGWVAEAKTGKDASLLTPEQQTTLFIGNFLEDSTNGGSDRFLKSIASGDVNAMKQAYYELHNTAPDAATRDRAEKIFNDPKYAALAALDGTQQAHKQAELASTTFDFDNMIGRFANQAKEDILGVPESAYAGAHGAANFVLSMAYGGYEGALELGKQIFKPGRLTGQQIIHALSVAEEAKKTAMEYMAYRPVTKLAEDVTAGMSYPFELAHSTVDKLLPEGTDPKTREAASFLTDMAIVFGPKLAREGYRAYKSAETKIANGEKLTDAEKQAYANSAKWKQIEDTAKVKAQAEAKANELAMNVAKTAAEEVQADKVAEVVKPETETASVTKSVESPATESAKTVGAKKTKAKKAPKLAKPNTQQVLDLERFNTVIESKKTILDAAKTKRVDEEAITKAQTEYDAAVKMRNDYAAREGIDPNAKPNNTLGIKVRKKKGEPFSETLLKALSEEEEASVRQSLADIESVTGKTMTEEGKVNMIVEHVAQRANTAAAWMDRADRKGTPKSIQHADEFAKNAIAEQEALRNIDPVAYDAAVNRIKSEATQQVLNGLKDQHAEWRLRQAPEIEKLNAEIDQRMGVETVKTEAAPETSVAETAIEPEAPKPVKTLGQKMKKVEVLDTPEAKEAVEEAKIAKRLPELGKEMTFDNGYKITLNKGGSVGRYVLAIKDVNDFTRYEYAHTAKGIREKIDGVIKLPKAEPMTNISSQVDPRIGQSSLYTGAEDTFKRYNNFLKVGPQMLNTPQIGLGVIVNDINRYIHKIGPEVDIDFIRERLQILEDTMSSRDFKTLEAEVAFKKGVAEANDFANLAKEPSAEAKATGMPEPRNVPTEPPGVVLGAGFDPSRLIVELRGTAKAMQFYMDKSRRAKKLGGRKTLLKKVRQLHRMMVDITGESKRMLDELPDPEAYVSQQMLVLRTGATALAKIYIEEADKAVFKGLSNDRKDLLNSILFARRVIAIDKLRKEIAIKTGKLDLPNHGSLTADEASALGLGDKPIKVNDETMIEYLNDLERVIGTTEISRLYHRADKLFDVMRDHLKMLKDEKIITTRTYNELVESDYLRRADIIDRIDPVVESRSSVLGQKRLSVRESGVSVIQKGKLDELLEQDARVLMAEVIASVHGRIFRNRANRALFDLATANPENGIVSIPKNPKSNAPRGWRKVDLFVDGEKRAIHLERTFADAWITADQQITFELANTLSTISGTKLLKMNATGINPGFAFANVPKDMLHSWLVSQMKINGKWTSTYSPRLPLALAQQASDIMDIKRDAYFRTGRYLDAAEDGMMMEFLSSPTPWFRPHHLVETGMDVVQKGVGWINTSSEIQGRLMLRERAMRRVAENLGVDWKEFNAANEKMRPVWKEGRAYENPAKADVPEEMQKLVMRIRTEGSYIARDYIDFSQHGSVGAVIDTMVPYFNPAIQGTRGIFRSAKRNPKEFAEKLGWLAAGASALNLFNNIVNREGYDNVSKETKQGNFIFMTSHKITTADGITRYLYFKWPKDPGQQYFTYMFDALTDKNVFGKDIDIPTFKQTINSLSPVDMKNMLFSIPSSSAVAAYLNIDAYRTFLEGEVTTIWKEEPMPDESKFRQYYKGRGDQNEPKWAVDASAALHAGGVEIRPSQVEAMIGAYFTNNGHLWTWASGKAYDHVFGPENGDHVRSAGLAEAISKWPVFRRFIGLTTSDKDHQFDIESDIEKNAALERFIVDNDLEVMLYDYSTGGSTTHRDLYKYMNEHPKYADKIEKEIEWNDLMMDEKYVNPNNRAFWRRMRRPQSNEERAQKYFAKYSELSPKQQKSLDRERFLLGYDSTDFENELYRVKKEGR